MIPASGLSVGARAAGSVIALAYLTGVVGGSLPGVVVALALVTFGRLLERPGDVLAGSLALALLATGLGIAALRWGELDVGAIQGYQAVLGPTVLVGAPAPVAACWLAAVSSVVALGSWIAGPARRPLMILRSAPEAAAGALAVVSLFWGPALPWGASAQALAAGAGVWLAGVMAVTAAAVGVALVLAPRREAHWVALGCAALALVTAAALVVGTP